MKQIIIRSKNFKGEHALRQHFRETKKLSLKQRLLFKTMGYKHEVLTEEPYTLILTINNRLSENELHLASVQYEIREAMKMNGAKLSDYEIEVK